MIGFQVIFHGMTLLHACYYRHMNDEALSFANGALSAGAQPTKIRKILQDKFDSNLISKDLINMKQKLIG